MPAKSYSVIVTPSDGRKTYHLRLSLGTLYMIGAALFVTGIAVVFLLVTYGELMWKVRNWTELQIRLSELTEKQAEYDALREEVEGLREMDRKIRKLVGLPEPVLTGSASATRSPGAPVDTRPPGMPDVELEEAAMPGGADAARIEKILAPRLGRLRWPVKGFVSSSFGDVREGEGIHSGIDIAAARNTLIETPLSGTVISAGWDRKYGNVAVIDHGGGLVTVYCHNAKLVVATGDKVKRGDTISFLGSTGLSSAPHLHFEIRQDGFAVDPLLLLAPREEP